MYSPVFGIVFLAALLGYVIYAQLTKRHSARRNIAVPFITQSIMIVMALWLGYRQNILTRELVSPLWLVLGLFTGHVVFLGSVAAAQPTWRELRELISSRRLLNHALDLHGLWAFVVDTPIVLTRHLFGAACEELVYRVGAQTLAILWLGSSWLGILLVAVVFAVAHDHFFVNHRAGSIEFLLFAILLGLLYNWTHSLTFIVLIHWVRNVEVAYLDFQLKCEALGDEALAREAIEQTYRMQRPENT